MNEGDADLGNGSGFLSHNIISNNHSWRVLKPNL